MSELILRRATIDDAGLLAMIGAATFYLAFAHDHPGDGLVEHVTTEHSVAYYRALLADPANAAWLVVTPLNAPIAYAVMTPPKVDCPTDPDDLELKRIYVHPAWQAGGWGAKLVDAIEAEAAARGAARLYLCVYTANHRAQHFYTRRGYADTGHGQRFMVGPVPFDDMIWSKPLV